MKRAIMALSFVIGFGISSPAGAQVTTVTMTGRQDYGGSTYAQGTPISVNFAYSPDLPFIGGSATVGSSFWDGAMSSDVRIGAGSYQFSHMQIDEDRFNIPGQGSTVVYNLFGWDSSTPGVGWRVTLTPTDQSNVSFTALPASNSLSSFSASSLFLYSNLPGQFVSLGGAYAPAIVVAETPTGESDFDPASIYAGRVSLFNEGSIISAKFSPGNGLSLSEAARSLGFDHFNWQQTLISADPLALPAILLAAHQSPPFFDPIPGGYSYNSGLNAYPYYYDSFNSFSDNGYNLAGHISADGKTLEFADQPNVPCLGGALAKNFCYSYFQTALVGVNTDGSLGSKLFEFAWKSNFSTDDAAGGVAILNAHPDVQLRGVGGVTLLSGKYFATAVPEPATWTMLSLGFGLIGYAMRRRPRRTVSVRCHSGCLQQ